MMEYLVVIIMSIFIIIGLYISMLKSDLSLNKSRVNHISEDKNYLKLILRKKEENEIDRQIEKKKHRIHRINKRINTIKNEYPFINRTDYDSKAHEIAIYFLEKEKLKEKGNISRLEFKKHFNRFD